MHLIIYYGRSHKLRVHRMRVVIGHWSKNKSLSIQRHRQPKSDW